MGFDRADIDRAMRAAFFNPDRAVAYLVEVSHNKHPVPFPSYNQSNNHKGIPENVQQEQQQPAPRGGPPTQATAETPTAPAAGTTPAAAEPSAEGDAPINLFEAAAQANRGGAGNTGGNTQRSRGTVTEAARGLNAAAGAQEGALGNTLDLLSNNPQFQQLRQIVQTQPRMLEPILQQVGAGNPQLATLIGQNPEQFLQLLAEDTEGDTPLPPGAQEISVTEEERAAIERVSCPFFHGWFRNH